MSWMARRAGAGFARGPLLPVALVLLCWQGGSMGFSVGPLGARAPVGGALHRSHRSAPRRACVGGLAMSEIDGKERLLRKIDKAHLSLAMSEAVAKALEDADQLLKETRSKSWNVRKGLEAESQRTLMSLREKRARIEELSMSEMSEEEVPQNPYIEMMEECAAKAKRGEAGREEVWGVLREMEDIGITPNTETYTSLIKALAKAAGHGKAGPKDGKLAVMEMKERGMRLTVVTASALLSLYAQTVKAGNKATIADGWAVLRDLEGGEGGVKGDAFVYAGLMDLCAKLSKAGECTLKDAREILAHMDGQGVHGDAYVYNSMLQVCTNGVETANTSLKDGLGILDKMKRREVKVDEFSCSLLLSLASKCIKARKCSFEDAIAVYDRLLEHKVAPNLVMYNTLLAVYVKGAERGLVGAEVVRDLLGKLEKGGVKPDRTFFGSCMSLLAGASLYGKATGQDARDIIDRIRAAGLAPSGETYRLWAKVLGNEALLGTASATSGLKVLEYIQSVGAAPTASIYSTIMDLISRAALHGKGSVADAERVLQDMRENDVPISEAILCSFLQVAKAEGGREATMNAWSVFAGAEPRIRSQRAFTLLISALARSGQRKTAFALIDVLRSSGVKPNMFVYNAALSAAPDAQGLLELYEKMKEDGVEGDKVTRRLVNAAKRGSKVYTTAPIPREVSRKHVLKRLMDQQNTQ